LEAQYELKPPVADDAEDRGGIDDDAAALFFHDVDFVLHAQPERAQIGFQNTVPFVVVVFDDGGIMGGGNTGVVESKVQTTVAVHEV
jgi:hypothetical protein